MHLQIKLLLEGIFYLRTIFKKLNESLNLAKGGEIHITDAIQSLIDDNDLKFIGHMIFAGKYLDCGTMKGYINSSLEISKI